MMLSSLELQTNQGVMSKEDFKWLRISDSKKIIGLLNDQVRNKVVINSKKVEQESQMCHCDG